MRIQHPKRFVPLDEARALYTGCDVKIHEPELDSYEIYNPNKRRGLEALVVPNQMFTYPDGSIYDASRPFYDDVVNEVFRAYEVDEYTELYASYCRFGIWWKDGYGRSLFRITMPDAASHVQVLGIEDDIDQGWMVTPESDVMQKMDFLTDYTYREPLDGGDVLRGWIFPVDFRLAEIQDNCLKQIEQALCTFPGALPMRKPKSHNAQSLRQRICNFPK